MSTAEINKHSSNNLDLLRLVFASLVLVSHAPELVDGNRSREILSVWTNQAQSFGEFAVAGFFALSGYLIMASWIRQPRLGAFFKKRILRIYPGFIVAFCISVLIVGPIAAPDLAAYFGQFTIGRYLFTMFTLREPWFINAFTGMHRSDTNGAMWTISYEFFCYVAVAFFGVLARQNLKPVWIAVSILLIVADCFPSKLIEFPQINRFYIYSFVQMASPFFIGGAFCLIGFRGMKSHVYLAMLGVIFALTCFSHRFNAVGFATFGTAFFISLGLMWQRPALIRNWPDISYGTYLYGWPVMQMVIWLKPDWGPWSVLGLSLTLSLMLGYLSWKLVEAPFIRLKSVSLPFMRQGRPA